MIHEKLTELLTLAQRECKAIEVVELSKALQELEQLQLDSDRWNALIHSPFRLFGFAGLSSDDPTQPDAHCGKNGYAHFGCEMWTNHDGWDAEIGKAILIGFADQAIRVQKEKSNEN